MDQIAMFQTMMAAYAREPEPPTTTLVTTPLAATSAKRESPPQLTLMNVDIVHLMSQLTGAIGVMSFASPITPGGGVQLGVIAQEQAIAKATYLVPGLMAHMDDYYKPNRTHVRRGLYTPHFIYAAHVRQYYDDQARIMTDHYVDIISVAAPDRRIDPTLPDACANEDLREKIQQTLRYFKAHQRTQLILGAFGAGVFGNPVAQVARIFAQQLKQPEFWAFEQIYFAIYDSGETVITPFRRAFEEEMAR